MLRNACKLAAVLVAAYALTNADARDGGTRASASLRPADELCVDAQVGKTFGGDVAGCREYLDACLSDLTKTQRAEWRRSVDSCLGGEAALYRCYAEVPWC
jgi:hypothetical protein